jgi:arylsulfatase A-like enzyme
VHPLSRRKLLAAGLAAPFFVHCKKASAPKPNIIFILADDLGWSDLGCYGNQVHRTPNIDNLAGQGLRFNYAYASAPVCAPPRASIHTGKYPARIRLTSWVDGDPSFTHKRLNPPKSVFKHLTLRQTTIAERLRQAGYRTGHIGKWHLGTSGHLPQDQGFDFASGGSEIGSPASYFYPNWAKQPDIPASDGAYLTDRLTDEAIKFLDENRNGRFFLNLCHYAVHVPLEAPPALAASYEARLAGDKSRSAIYAAMVDSLDQNTGRLLKKLDDLNLTSNTAVFFVSDNGGLHVPEWKCITPTTNAPLRAGKGYLYEGGIRTPAIIRWPGVTRANLASNTPVISMDYHHTMAAMAGIEDGLSKDGQNLVPLLRRTAPLSREALYWHFPHYSNQGGMPGGAIRMGNFKLIRFYEDQRSELYNVRDDVAESLNLVSEMKERADQMLLKLNGWLGTLQAPLMTPNREWKRDLDTESLAWQKSCPA